MPRSLQTPPSPSHDPTGGGTLRPTRPAPTHDGAGSTCAPVPVRAALALSGPDFQMRRELLILSSCVSSLTVEKGCSLLPAARKRRRTYKNPELRLQRGRRLWTGPSSGSAQARRRVGLAGSHGCYGNLQLPGWTARFLRPSLEGWSSHLSPSPFRPNFYRSVPGSLSYLSLPAFLYLACLRGAKL